MDGLGGFPAGVYGLGSAAEILRLLLAIVAVGVVLHFSALKVLGRSTFAEGVVCAFLAAFSSFMLHGLLSWKPVALLLSLAAFAALVMLVYRAKGAKGLALGAGAFLAWMLVGWLLSAVAGAS